MCDMYFSKLGDNFHYQFSRHFNLKSTVLEYKLKNVSLIYTQQSCTMIFNTPFDDQQIQQALAKQASQLQSWTTLSNPTAGVSIIACSTPAMVELKVQIVTSLLQQNMSLQNKPLHHCLMKIHCIETTETASQAFKILIEKISLECSIKVASLVFFQETLLIK